MSAAERVAIEDAFKQYDKDDSGYINSSELFALCAELGAELSESELRKAVLKLDTDDSGAIELVRALCAVELGLTCLHSLLASAHTRSV